MSSAKLPEPNKSLEEVETLVQEAQLQIKEVVKDNPQLELAVEESLGKLKAAVSAQDSVGVKDAASQLAKVVKSQSSKLISASESAKLAASRSAKLSEKHSSKQMPNTNSKVKFDNDYDDIEDVINVQDMEDVTLASDTQVISNKNSAVLKDLEEAEQNAVHTANKLNELKARVSCLLKLPKMSPDEAQELDQINDNIRELMQKFDEKIKRIQFIVDENSVNKTFRNDADSKLLVVDSLPKLIIGDPVENMVPKIIICDPGKTKTDGRPFTSPTAITKRLSESYNMQEKLAAENADLEGKRYQLQEDLLDKDQTVESLQRKLCDLKTELRRVACENNNLNNKLQVREKKSKKKMNCGGGPQRSLCPADVECRLMEYSSTTQQLEKQLHAMEMDMRNVHCELQCVQNERQQLEEQKRMRGCCRPPCNARGCDQQLRELREQYNRLQDDFKTKLTEVAGLRADTERWRNAATIAEEAKKVAEDKLKDAGRDLKNRSDKNKVLGSKEIMELEQQLSAAKERFRDAQVELEEMRAFIADQEAQLADYREKYLQAQQQVEEQRRQIGAMELQSCRITELVNVEISRVKNQFQEKLLELTPLPDILKATQLKLQEAQQLHLLAERNNETLMRELQAQREKAASLQTQLEQYLNEQVNGASTQEQLVASLNEIERRAAELQDDNRRLKEDLKQAEELADLNEKIVQEKLHEIVQLEAQQNNVREESAKQVARTKERCETVRRSMQCQIFDMDKQLAQARAAASSIQKERDEIRQNMQMQINNLKDNFEAAQGRICSLQNHINFLKTSYTDIYPNGGQNANQILSDGADACDCGHNL